MRQVFGFWVTLLARIVRLIGQIIRFIGRRIGLLFGGLYKRLDWRGRLVMILLLLGVGSWSVINLERLAVSTFNAVFHPVPPVIAPFFTREVQYWRDLLDRWGTATGIDPNLGATVMQIESCGLSSAASSAGAQGLFQVMPFHFTAAEQSRMTDPELNAEHAFNVLKECLGYSDGDASGALACYNGGPSQIYIPQEQRNSETKRYVFWGSGMYADAKRGATTSAALQNWLDSGGIYLCEQAAASLGLPTATPVPTSSSPATEIPMGSPTVLPTFENVTASTAAPSIPTFPSGALPTFNPQGN